MSFVGYYMYCTSQGNASGGIFTGHVSVQSEHISEMFQTHATGINFIHKHGSLVR